MAKKKLNIGEYDGIPVYDSLDAAFREQKIDRPVLSPQPGADTSSAYLHTFERSFEFLTDERDFSSQLFPEKGFYHEEYMRSLEAIVEKAKTELKIVQDPQKKYFVVVNPFDISREQTGYVYFHKGIEHRGDLSSEPLSAVIGMDLSKGDNINFNFHMPVSYNVFAYKAKA
ncbi:MAG: hypothetical protein KKF44_08815 [Nanoarchaeota archaeon]|nr:hypothetical protein [Nanoarchaeota archaeon]